MREMAVVRLTVTLDRVEPPVRRVLEVLADTDLEALHLALQAAMPWQNYHLWQVELGDRRWVPPDPEDGLESGTLHPEDMKVGALMAGAGPSTFVYTYDFGDGWKHTVVAEPAGPAPVGVLYPRLIEAEGRCPPEDVGGPLGYEDFLAALKDRKHPLHRHFREWWGTGGFDTTCNYGELAAGVEALAEMCAAGGKVH